jgi:hypothetical protein
MFAELSAKLPKKLAAQEGAAKFREETSKKAAHHVPCGAHLAPHHPKRKRHSMKNHHKVRPAVACCKSTTAFWRLT